MAEQITARSKNFADWYVDIVTRAQLADYSPVRGSMVIRPRGYAVWELMQSGLDGLLKESGHTNAYFPVLIPESFLRKEAEHVEGFAPELAVVTHAGGEELEEPLVVRPTSETIIWSMYRKWIHSYRDLPLLINQWANVIRWEKRTRLFLRTTEFLWQEGHTAHATEAEAREETLRMLDIYREFAEDYMAMPVIRGLKTESEKFAGAVETYAIEALMQDARALQAGTSHFLGQNFARAFDVTYQSDSGQMEHVWATSWGVSTRLIGGLIMTHSDDKGLVLPPRLAPDHVVIIPILKGARSEEVLAAAARLRDRLRGLTDPWGRKLSVKLDDDGNNSPGWKFAEWELRGVPLRIELGPRDLDKDACMLARRDSGEKASLPLSELDKRIPELLAYMQTNMFQKALDFRTERTREVRSMEELRELFSGDGGAGYAILAWDGSEEVEQQIKAETRATARVIPFDANPAGKRCIVTGKEARQVAYFARAY